MIGEADWDREEEGRRIGARLRGRRAELGLSAADVAQALGVDPVTWMRLEERGAITAAQLQGAARVMDISPHLLLDVDGPDPREEAARMAQVQMRRIDDPAHRRIALTLLGLLADLR